jgi:hypothetical protein
LLPRSEGFFFFVNLRGGFSFCGAVGLSVCFLGNVFLCWFFLRDADAVMSRAFFVFIVTRKTQKQKTGDNGENVS